MPISTVRSDLNSSDTVDRFCASIVCDLLGKFRIVVERSTAATLPSRVSPSVLHRMASSARQLSDVSNSSAARSANLSRAALSLPSDQNKPSCPSCSRYGHVRAANPGCCSPTSVRLVVGTRLTLRSGVRTAEKQFDVEAYVCMYICRESDNEFISSS